MKKNPADILYSRGVPFAVLVAVDDEYRDTWCAYVPSIRPVRTYTGKVHLIDTLPNAKGLHL